MFFQKSPILFIPVLLSDMINDSSAEVDDGSGNFRGASVNTRIEASLLDLYCCFPIVVSPYPFVRYPLLFIDRAQSNSRSSQTKRPNPIKTEITHKHPFGSLMHSASPENAAVSLRSTKTEERLSRVKNCATRHVERRSQFPSFPNHSP